MTCIVVLLWLSYSSAICYLIRIVDNTSFNYWANIAIFCVVCHSSRKCVPRWLCFNIQIHSTLLRCIDVQHNIIDIIHFPLWAHNLLNWIQLCLQWQIIRHWVEGFYHNKSLTIAQNTYSLSLCTWYCINAFVQCFPSKCISLNREQGSQNNSRDKYILYVYGRI